MSTPSWKPRVIAERKETLPANDTLFRTEVIVARQTQWLGPVLLAPRISHGFFMVFAAAAIAAILSLLFFAEYTRKARVNGWLIPQQGVVRIYAPQAGVVTRIDVREGAEVAKGAPLLTVSTEVHSAALSATREEIVHRLTERRDSLAAQRQRQQQLFAEETDSLTKRLETLRSEQKHLDQEIEVQHARMKLASEDAARQRVLRQKDITTVQRLLESQQNELQQSATLQTLERNRATIDREVFELQGQLRQSPLKNLTLLAEIDRGVAALEQDLAEAEIKRQLVITAPQAGTVTEIQVESGGGVNTTVPLLSIVPEGSRLEALLFSPSRAIGFVRPGQHVLLRYQAFPYQKFGYYEGQVASVSRSAVSPSEMTQQLSGLTSLYGPNEPVYRITVDLASQTATAYGEHVPLQPGMQLEADVLIESRRLIEWVLDPLFTLTGKWQR